MQKIWKTREVKVGKIGVGGNNPVRIQSMTTSNTRDSEATALQIMRLADTGCEIARVTVQGIKEAESCEHIKNILVQKGYDIPLVADIHFYPPAAMKVADFVDKIRINPGNFIDKRASFKTILYDDASYQEELERLEEGFSPLVEKCKKLKRAMRIGTNHGSLSDRAMNRFGDSPRGMVESALEFTRVCRKLDFHDIIFSMKASNPVVMIEAYRLLVKEMMALGWDYPLHLGVTEAGDGEDGRIKSSIGIGTLLLDGIGDTIRVSLTEDPWEEIDPCKRLIQYTNAYRQKAEKSNYKISPVFQREEKREVPSAMGSYLHRDGTAFLALSNEQILDPDFCTKIGLRHQNFQWKKSDQTIDAILVEDICSEIQPVLEKIKKAGVGIFSLKNDVVHVKPGDDWNKLLELDPKFLLVNFHEHPVHEMRNFSAWLKQNHYKAPVLLSFDYNLSEEDLIIGASCELGSLLTDGFAVGLCMSGKYDTELLKRLSFGILQASRMRSTKTEYISCPGCGRTLFQLQEVTQKIRKRTEHLPGVKIAVMGCIVNGPGEMADADFGYVGSKPGKIDLYVGKTCVQKDIEFSDAEERLVDLIKAHGRWKEKEEENQLVTV